MKKESKKGITPIAKRINYLATHAIICIAALFLMAANMDKIRVVVSKTGLNFPVLKSKLNKLPRSAAKLVLPVTWKAPDDNTIPAGKAGNMIRYGKDLLANTGRYLGPQGTVARLTNGMNCQNCHLDGGTKLFANNYAGFISSYPKLSNRSGNIESASARIVECFERSLSGRAPDTSGKEVQAILAYMKWIGTGVKKGQKVYGSGTEKLAFMDRPADPVKGKALFVTKCRSCHGNNGEGQLAADKKIYIYPPLWGGHSYNDGAGMYRISNMAGFIKNNMPFGATYKNPQLMAEQAWDLAAYINSQPRTHKDQHNDWKNRKKKPIDFPFGPYADAFSEKQHKYGPFKPIADRQKELTKL